MRTYTPFLDEALKRDFGTGTIIFYLVFLAIVYIPLIFYVLTLIKNLTLINLKNRTMEPNLAWLALIPLFNLVWNFYIVAAVRNSNQKEFHERNIQYTGDFGYGIGLAYCILFCINFVPCFNFLSPIPSLICWIMYWIKVSELTRFIIVSDLNKTDKQQNP